MVEFSEQRLARLVGILRRRGIILPAFEIHGGAAGLYDFGPVGGRLRNRVNQTWIDHWQSLGNIVEISAVITDRNTNSTLGTSSSTLITIDLTPPVIANYAVSSVISTGGTVVDNYWNSTNTGLDVIIKPQKDPSDASVSGGSVRVLAGIGADSLTADYYQLGDPVLINAVNNNVNDGIPIAIVKDSVISQIDYDQ